MNAKKSLRRILARGWFVVGVACSGLLVAVALSFFLPRVYETSAMVRVVDNSALYAAYGEEQPEGATALPSLAEELSASPLLADVAKRIADGDADLERELVEGMEGSVSVTSVGTDDTGEKFEVSSSWSDPDTARRIVAEIATSWNRGRDEEADSVRTELQRVREELRLHAESHAVALTALDVFTKEHSEYRFVGDDDAEHRRQKTVDQLADVQKDITTLSGKLEGIREELVDEPEWETEEDKQGNIERVKNPVWVDLRSSERDVLAELTVRRRLAEDYEVRIEKLTALAAAWPELKKEWDRLSHDESERRDNIVTLRAEEKAAKEAWRSGAAATALIYDVVASPVLPTEPIGLSLAVFSAFGLLLGLLIATIWVLAASMFDRSFQSPSEVAMALDVQVLGSIDRIETLIEREARVKRGRLAAAAAIILAVTSASALFMQLSYEAEIRSFLRETVHLIR